MKELAHRQPPDRGLAGMSRTFWLTVEQQEEICGKFLNRLSSRRFGHFRRSGRGD